MVGGDSESASLPMVLLLNLRPVGVDGLIVSESSSARPANDAFDSRQ